MKSSFIFVNSKDTSWFNFIVKKTLKQILSITSGIYAKTSLSGEALYLHAKYFDGYGSLMETVKPDLKIDQRMQKHLLQADDVLFISKGFKNFAIRYVPDFGPAVASSTFLILRIEDHSLLLPDYLVWWLNSPSSQKYYQAYAKGSSLPSITKKTLGDLEIHIPPLKKQELVIKIQHLKLQEQKLAEKIDSLKETLLEEKLYQATL